MRAIHTLGTLPLESSNYQAAAERSVLGIHIQPVEVNSWRTGSLGRSTHLALSPKPEVFIQDHLRLITLKDLKEGELVVSEPTERRLGDQ